VAAFVRDAGSFRDRSGEIYFSEGRIFRTVNRTAAAEYETLRGRCFYEKAAATGFLIGAKEIDVSVFGSATEDVRYLVEHPRLDFISYPYEWSFAQLKAAALLHLDLQLFALDAGVVLSDASAYNVQFVGSRPIFVDLLSFRCYRDGEYWSAHGQFCEQFLNPLLLRSICGVPHNAWYRGNLNGVPGAELSRLIPFGKKFSKTVLWNVILPSRLQHAARGKDFSATAGAMKKLPQAAYRRMLATLRRRVDGLKPADKEPGDWQDYADNNTYASDEAELKKQAVLRFVRQSPPECLWDLGCNTGAYAEAAIGAGARRVVGFDRDLASLDKAFQRAREHSLPFLPLYLDAANPSPAQGWNGAERKALQQRGKCDAVLALAFVHHLAIGRNVPLDWVVEWITGLSPRGLIEFVPKDDPTIRKMLAFREDIFSDYSEPAFEAALGKRARICNVETISRTGRKIYAYEKA
jgi:ribosomal protein L11 methylase PrmA